MSHSPPVRFADDAAAMCRAVSLAERGRGLVEPNPMVGAVVVDEQWNLLGEGWHDRFGGAHAEVHALAQAGDRARGATLFVTLEPCCHFGKTGPCTRAILQAGIRRVVVGIADPFHKVSGGGIAELRSAGVLIEVGLLSDDCERLAAPFLKLTTTGLPWVHAKWAMTLDGRIATRTGSSKWITNERSRAAAHRVRGLMDAIVIGAGTARADDPLLTVRPPGPRTPVRIVVDSRASLSLDSQLVRTAREIPVLVACTRAAPSTAIDALQSAGVNVLPVTPTAAEHSGDAVDLDALLRELGQRRMTHVLLEGGGCLLGSAFDAGLVDEVHVHIGPKLVGGAAAPGPVGGLGLSEMSAALTLEEVELENLDGDIHLHGRVRKL